MDSQKVLLHRRDQSMSWANALVSSTYKKAIVPVEMEISLFPFFKQEWVALIPQNLTLVDFAAASSQYPFCELFRKSSPNKHK
jgi:hypothetical protein